MPQLDIATFAPQLVWLAISFILLYVLMAWVGLPRISKAIAARRARMLGVGVLTGAYGEDELTRAGAFRVYRDAAELYGAIDELGVLS